MFILESYKELTDQKLGEFINKHQTLSKDHFKKLDDAYKTKYEIFDQEAKDSWKPDNRIAVNFAKYIVDTMNGFFIGHPIKITADGDNAEAITEYVEFLDQYNDQDDNNAELSKICSNFGRGYEMYYVDNGGNIGITYLTPMESFMIYDESIIERPRFFVRLYKDTDNVLHGSLSDHKTVRYFISQGGISWEHEKEKPHGFDGVPATEYKENDERQGLFEPVLPMIDAYNKAISEKANDVDYFADAYLKILGAKLDEEGVHGIRNNRLINFAGEDADKMVVDFLNKPDGDTTQEHLIDRLERLIFQIAMVANISDENFGSASGVALRYKLASMSNLAKTKERKFTSGMNRRYRLIFSNPVNKMNKDDWVKLKYKFTQNYPANLLEEAQIAAQLSGVVSKETQLKILSVIDNVQAEIDLLKEEQDPIGYETDYPTNRTIEEE